MPRILPATIGITLGIQPRLLSREDAKAYLGGLEPETIGVAPVPAKSRRIRFDLYELDRVLNQLSSIVLDCANSTPAVASRLDELLGSNG